MNKIGFSNFRRFKDFPEMQLGEITILVGGNNAGKSTLVKAILLMRDFLKNRIESVDNTDNIFKTMNPQFNFDTEHVNVGEFYRAFCRQSPRKENTISFTMGIDHFRFIVSITGERKPGVVPEVTMIAVSDEDRNIHFIFDFTKGQMSVRFVYDEEALNGSMMEDYPIALQIEHLKSAISKSKDLDEISRLKLKLEQLEKKAYALTSDIRMNEYDSVTIDMSYFIGDNAGKLIIPELIKGFAHYAEIGTLGDRRSLLYKEQESTKFFLRGKVSEINAVSEELEKVLNKQVIEYIYAHSVYQDSIYAKCANSSDYTKRTIHDFYNARISHGDDEFSLIEDWLKEFKIGNSFKVVPYKGDNYSLVIFDDDNPEITSNTRKGYPGGIDLADKGMGSIQLVILLLRLATLIRKYKGQQLTVLLEEPEQNLHPALQSKLAELVFNINKEYGVRFVIESHSEYLIRKTQVIVAGLNKSDNYARIPFKVIYLPDNGEPPYDMQYRTDGKFLKEFGPGFFDEAAKLAFKIF